jgi:hypothetical protein
MSMNHIQTVLELLFQRVDVLGIGFMWSRIFSGPLGVIIRDRYGVSPLLTGRVNLHHLLLTRLDPNLVSEAVDLVQDHLAHFWYVLDNLEAKVEGLRTGGLI